MAAPSSSAPARFGEIPPALVAALGRSVTVGLSFEARRAQAREFAGGERRTRIGSPLRPLPPAIPTVRELPPSRVRAGLVTGE